MIRHIVTQGVGPGSSGVRYIVTRGLRSKRLSEILDTDAIASMDRATVTGQSMGRLTSVTAGMGRGTRTTGEMH